MIKATRSELGNDFRTDRDGFENLKHKIGQKDLVEIEFTDGTRTWTDICRVLMFSSTGDYSSELEKIHWTAYLNNSKEEQITISHSYIVLPVDYEEIEI